MAAKWLDDSREHDSPAASCHPDETTGIPVKIADLPPRSE